MIRALLFLLLLLSGCRLADLLGPVTPPEATLVQVMHKPPKPCYIWLRITYHGPPVRVDSARYEVPCR